MSNELTPMMKQYMQTKEEYKDCILFYRLGDFMKCSSTMLSQHQKSWKLL